jgi:hypothetical protein
MMPMTLPITRLVLSFVLIALGAASWIAAGVAEDLAFRQERFATFQETPGAAGDAWEALERALDPAAGRHARLVDYWNGRYDSVTATGAADAESLLIAANASFRKAQREAGARLPSVERLDQVMQAYAGVLKNGGFHRDAAFNYEYVARLRDALAKSRPSPGRPTAAPAAAAPRGDDLPAGRTAHGRPGNHPPNATGEEFEVITPMDYGEREAQPEPTPGRPPRRKG